jgi:hypothetical protein
MTLTFWWRLHTLGWIVWLPVTICFAAFVAWAAPVPSRRDLVPWAALATFLFALAADDLRTGWHSVYWSSKPMWGAGLLAMAVLAALPIAVCLGLASRVLAKFSGAVSRTLALAIPALLVQLLLGADIARWIQRGLLD